MGVIGCGWEEAGEESRFRGMGRGVEEGEGEGIAVSCRSVCLSSLSSWRPQDAEVGTWNSRTAA